MKNALFLSVFAVACIPAAKDTADTATDTDTTPAVSASVSWDADAVNLTISNGSDTSEYVWGIAENANCDDCWTGEDCFGGYELNDGSLLSFCHPVAIDGGMLAYGATPADVVEGATTVFGSADFGPNTTHILDDVAAGGSCWIWGADTSYYSTYEKSCTEF